MLFPKWVEGVSGGSEKGEMKAGRMLKQVFFFFSWSPTFNPAGLIFSPSSSFQCLNPVPKVFYRVWTGTYYCQYSYSKIRLLDRLMYLRLKLSQEKCACVCVLQKVVVVVGQCTCNTLHKHSVVTTQHDSTFDLVKFEGHTKNTCSHPTKKKKSVLSIGCECFCFTALASPSFYRTLKS